MDTGEMAVVLHRINSARLECHFPRFPSWDGSGLGLATRSGRREGSSQQYVPKAGALAGGCCSSRPPLLAGRPSAGPAAPAWPLPCHLGPARREELCQVSAFPPTASPAVPRLRQVLLSGTLPSSARTTADTGFDRAAVTSPSNPSGGQVPVLFLGREARPSPPAAHPQTPDEGAWARRPR